MEFLFANSPAELTVLKGKIEANKKSIDQALETLDKLIGSKRR